MLVWLGVRKRNNPILLIIYIHLRPYLPATGEPVLLFRIHGLKTLVPGQVAGIHPHFFFTNAPSPFVADNVTEV